MTWVIDKADPSRGDTGGPVFGWWSGWPYVIGAHSGLIGWARTNW